MCHEVNKIWCELHGDFSQSSWVDAPGWQQESAVNGVKFHLANPSASDSASHDAWMAEKKAPGWVYGRDKDPDLKTPLAWSPLGNYRLSNRRKMRYSGLRSTHWRIEIPALISGFLTMDEITFEFETIAKLKNRDDIHRISRPGNSVALLDAIFGRMTYDQLKEWAEGSSHSAKWVRQVQKSC